MTASAHASTITALRAFARARSSDHGRCDVCGAAIAAGHAHLVEAPALKLSCACLACSAAPPPTLLRVMPRVDRVDAQRAAAVADRFGLPVGLAFLVATSAPAPRVVARFPGPAGATMGELAEGALEAIAELAPRGLRRDVEALLIDRQRAVAFLVSIDRCFELTGLLRAGHSADAFFAALDGEAARD